MDGERVRGNVDLGISRLGKQELADLKRDFQRFGGLDIVFTSPLYRMRKTAQAIVSPQGTIVVTPALLSWDQGMYEGWPSDAAKPEILKYVLETPDEPIPGVGPYTGQPGGAFNAYVHRFLFEALKPALEFAKENPDKKVGMTIHSRNSKIAKAWLQEGMPDHLKMTPALWNVDDPPASVHCFCPDGKSWRMEDVDPAKMEPQKGCLFAIRHVATNWNGEKTAA